MVIRNIAATIRSGCRTSDFAARYGGEEFTVILPETPMEGAIELANRIRERIKAEQFPGIGSITASIGISNYPVNALSKEDLIRVADQALYIAKNGGRDRVAYFNYNRSRYQAVNIEQGIRAQRHKRNRSSCALCALCVPPLPPLVRLTLNLHVCKSGLAPERRAMGNPRTK
jgi:predicted signal transduction protein with EAL and GGDEF domain